MTSRARTATLLLFAASLLLSACNTAEFIEIEPKSFSFHRRNEKIWARIIAKNRNGHTFPGTKANWKSSNDKVVSVDDVGHVESVGPGHATITAKSGDMSAEAIVEVITVEKVVVVPPTIALDMESGSKIFVAKAFDIEGHELPDRKPSSRCESDKVCTATDNTVFPTNPGSTTMVVSVEGQKFEVPVTVTEKAAKKK